MKILFNLILVLAQSDSLSRSVKVVSSVSISNDHLHKGSGQSPVVYSTPQLASRTDRSYYGCEIAFREWPISRVQLRR